MVCKECKNKPLVRGIKFVKCLKCGKDCHVMYGDLDICEECSDEFGICNRCGKEGRNSSTYLIRCYKFNLTI